MSAADKCEKSDHLSSKDENGSLSMSDASKEDKSESEVNSYKFPRPRVYVKNCYKSEKVPVLTTLKEISITVGSKPRLPEYDSYIERQLQLSNPLRRI